MNCAVSVRRFSLERESLSDAVRLLLEPVHRLAQIRDLGRRFVVRYPGFQIPLGQLALGIGDLGQRAGDPQHGEGAHGERG